MLKNRSMVVATLFGAFFAACSCVCSADEISDSARKIVETNKDAIVTVQLVVEMKMSYESQTEKRESKSSSTGVVIDPSGLVVTSLTAVNPADRAQDMGADEGYGVSSRIVDAKVKLSDGTEVPVDVVLRDRDLDMIFLRPKKAPEQPMSYIDLAQSGAPQMMEATILLSRLGQIANRAISASMDRVASVITKPRLCYVLTGISNYNLGCPVFTMSGKVVGITFVRLNVNVDEDSSASDKYLPITLPCSTIMNAAAQAKTAAPEKLGEASPAPTKKVTTTKTSNKPAKKPAK